MATLPEGPVPDFIAQAMKSALSDFRSEWLQDREEDTQVSMSPIPRPYEYSEEGAELIVHTKPLSHARKNSFAKEKWSATVVIRDFTKIAQFQIYTGNFNFDSYDPVLSEGWELRVKQRFYVHVRSVSAELVGPMGTIKIRVDRRSRLWHVKMISVDDVIEAFCTCFDLNIVSKPYHATTTKVKPISAYSDAELLEEVHARTMARVGDFRAKKPKARVVTDNVIELDDVKRRLFDEEKVRRLIEAA